jgi:hypothetical protein
MILMDESTYSDVETSKLGRYGKRAERGQRLYVLGDVDMHEIAGVLVSVVVGYLILKASFHKW